MSRLYESVDAMQIVLQIASIICYSAATFEWITSSRLLLFFSESRVYLDTTLFCMYRVLLLYKNQANLHEVQSYLIQMQKDAGLLAAHILVIFVCIHNNCDTIQASKVECVQIFNLLSLTFYW